MCSNSIEEKKEAIFSNMGYLSVWGRSLDVAVLITTAAVTCVAISGLIANAILIFSVLRQPSLRRSPTYVTLLSLAASDFLALLFTPQSLYVMFTGGLDSTFCVIYFYVFQATFLSGANHLMLFSILRYMLLVKPLMARKYITIKVTMRMCAAVWIVSLTFSIPLPLNMELVSVNTSDNYSVSVCLMETFPTGFAIFAILTFAVIPMVVMAIFHILKVWQLRMRTMQPVQGVHKEQVSARIVAGILVVFAISCFPSIVYWGITGFSGGVTLDTLGTGYVLASAFSFINNATNPMFYLFLSGRVRKKLCYFRSPQVNKTVEGTLKLSAVCS